MVIRITDNCGQYCLHCMQESGPDKKKFMDINTFERSLEFIKTTNTLVISISGGEPTRHPDILRFLELAVKTKRMIVLLSNGDFIFDDINLADKIFTFLYKNKNLSIQITSVRGVYTRYHSITNITEHLMNRYSRTKIRIRSSQFTIVNKLELGYTTVGRAIDNTEKLDKVSFITDRKAPRCFNPYSILQNFSFTNNSIELYKVVNVLKSQTTSSLCIPMIKENGDMVFGEYESCNSVWNVNNDTDVVTIADIVGPCGACFYHKQQKDTCDQYLPIFKNKYNKLRDM